MRAHQGDKHYGERDAWTHYNPVRLRFGEGVFNELPDHVVGGRTLLLTSSGFSRRGLVSRVRELLGTDVQVMSDIGPNPELEDLEARAADVVAGCAPDVIVAVGGGSVMDTAKVLGVAVALRGRSFSLRRHLFEGGEQLSAPALPVVAVPTTAGTGSEVTPFATVWDRKSQKKHSLSGPMLYPHTALLDPELGVTLPREMTIVTGLDAVSQAFEAIWNRNATPVATVFATEALKTAMPTLKLLAGDLRNVKLRRDMLWASLLAGLAISQTRTALAHSMSYPLTMRLGMPHGLACGFTLAAVLQFNALADDGRLYRLAKELGVPHVRGLHGLVARLLQELNVSTMVGKYIASPKALLELVPEMVTLGRADNNLRPVTEDDLKDIIAAVDAH